MHFKLLQSYASWLGRSNDCSFLLARLALTESQLYDQQLSDSSRPTFTIKVDLRATDAILALSSYCDNESNENNLAFRATLTLLTIIPNCPVNTNIPLRMVVTRMTTAIINSFSHNSTVTEQTQRQIVTLLGSMGVDWAKKFDEGLLENPFCLRQCVLGLLDGLEQSMARLTPSLRGLFLDYLRMAIEDTTFDIRILLADSPTEFSLEDVIKEHFEPMLCIWRIISCYIDEAVGYNSASLQTITIGQFQAIAAFLVNAASSEQFLCSLLRQLLALFSKLSLLKSRPGDIVALMQSFRRFRKYDNFCSIFDSLGEALIEIANNNPEIAYQYLDLIKSGLFALCVRGEINDYPDAQRTVREGGKHLGGLLKIILKTDRVFCESYAANLVAEFPISNGIRGVSEQSDSINYLAELLGQVAIATCDESIGRICLSSLFTQFGQIPTGNTQERQYFLNQFGKIATCCSGALFNSVIDTLLALLKSGIHPNLTLTCFGEIAHQAQEDGVKRDVVLVTLLRHFVDVGIARLSSKKSERESVRIDLSQLLGIICTSLGTYPEGELNENIIYIEIFQEFWMTLILIGYVPDLNWRSDWVDAVSTISRSSPILIKPRDRLQSPETTFSEVVLGKPVSPSLRAHLGSFLSNQSASSIRNLNLAQCLWLLSIFFSERGKLSKGYVQHFIQYLKSEIIELLDLEMLVADMLSVLLAKSNVIETETLVGLARLLIGNLGNIQTRTHQLSLNLLEKHFFDVYSVYTDREIWQLLIVKLSNMFVICRSEIGSRHLQVLPGDLTQDPTAGKTSFRDILGLCRKVFTRCARECPNYFFKFVQQKLYGPSSVFTEGDRDVALLELLRLIIPAESADERRSAITYLQSGYLLYRNAENFVHQEALEHSMDNVSTIEKIIELMCTLNEPAKVKKGIRLWMSFIESNPILQARLLNCLSRRLGRQMTEYQTSECHPLRTRIRSLPTSPSNDDATADLNISCAILLDFISEQLQFDCVRNTDLLSFYHSLVKMLLTRNHKSLPRFVQFRILLFVSEVLRVSEPDLVEVEHIVELLYNLMVSFLSQTRYLLETVVACSSEEIGIMRDLIEFFKREMNQYNGKRRGNLAGAASLIINNHLVNSLVWQDFERKDEYLEYPYSRRELVTEVTGMSLGLALRLVQIPRISYLNLPASGIEKASIQAIESNEVASIILERGYRVSLDTLVYAASIFLPTAISTLRAASSSPSPSKQSSILKLNLAMRSLEDIDPTSLFFYIPQLVQSLRYDLFGFAQRSILHVAKVSSHFAHQIIWNMRANSFIDEGATQPDTLKPLLDIIMKRIEEQFSRDSFAFYQREFAFFEKVTSISGALKPLVKREKWEKKAKIDEELAKIKVDPGVYLPSSPEYIVVDIDYDSGRPLQSHAKAPFMATFRVQNGNRAPSWQSAIFKVGDDCRQDVLALQLINLAKTLFEIHHLPLYLFPYRVVATAPGCGVIEVIPKSISRDQLGREKINSLYDYFVFRFGGETSRAFHEARLNFVRSMAAYSVICYLLAIKDRHNGNIMIDDTGNIIHIDFGFILDIAPGGITFESAPFKLTSEMLQVMGGKEESPYFRWFRELCVQAFLILRTYAEAFIQLVEGMADSGLPCFRGEKTLRNLKNRFRLDLDPEGARQLMYNLVYKSCENVRTAMYDRFQLSQNGIPY